MRMRRFDGPEAGRFAAQALTVAAGLSGLGWWLTRSLRALPFDYSDLAYLFSLEEGRWCMQEWVHPLYIPFLALYRAALSLSGVAGRMLLPVERLNIAIGALTLAALYRVAVRASGQALASLVGVGMLALSTGYWQGCLRPVPYALAAAALALSLSVLAAPAARRDDPRLYALAGAFGGACCAFHAAGLSLVPVSAAMAFLDGRDAGRRLRLFLAFLGCFLAVAAASYPVFMAYHGIGMEFFRHASFSEIFRGIEQAPGTSIYTHPSFVGQAADYLATLRQHGEAMCVAVALTTAAGFLLPRRDGRASPEARRLGLLAAANFVSFAAFFILNNALNGFVFASLVGLPFTVAGAARARRGGAALALALAALFHTHVQVPDRGYLAAQQTPFLKETVFLAGTAAPTDVLLMPGCPFPELFYARHFDVLQIAEDTPEAARCQAPSAAGEKLAARVSYYLGHGRRVFVAEGVSGGPGGIDVSGGWKTRQIFMPQDDRGAAALLAPLLARARPVRSGNGWMYEELAPPGRVAPAAADAARKGPDFDSIRRILSRRENNPDIDRRIAYLARWNAASPEDPYVGADLTAALRWWASCNQDREMRREALAELLPALHGFLPERDVRDVFVPVP